MEINRPENEAGAKINCVCEVTPPPRHTSLVRIPLEIHGHLSAFSCVVFVKGIWLSLSAFKGDLTIIWTSTEESSKVVEVHAGMGRIAKRKKETKKEG